MREMLAIAGLSLALALSSQSLAAEIEWTKGTRRHREERGVVIAFAPEVVSCLLEWFKHLLGPFENW